MAGSGAPRVGVLALQGDFREHLTVLHRLGADAIPVRRPADLDQVVGLVIPGGESTVMDKLARLVGLVEPVRARIGAGMPVYGTCAGLIMLADTVRDAIPGQQTFGGLDVVVRRNAFGGQNESFEADLDVPELGEPAVHAVFIRAPVVEEVGPRARSLAALPDGRVVAVEQNRILATAFHPEMTGESRFHERFLRTVVAASAAA